MDLKLMHEKNELLKALNRAHNEIKSKESLLQRMECDYYDKIVEMEQHSVDLYAEQVRDRQYRHILVVLKSFRRILLCHNSFVRISLVLFSP